MKEEVKIMNRETFELDANETCMSLEDYTLFEKALIMEGIDNLLSKNGVLRKYTTIVDKKAGLPEAIVLEWKYNRDIMKNTFDINKIIRDSICEAYKSHK